MKPVQEMLKSHPRGVSGADLQALQDCLMACHECEATCTSCADACLAEQGVEQLRRCIRLNLDCADACAATGKILLRLTEPEWGFMTQQVAAMAMACKLCAEECEKHAARHAHCRVCAGACRRCEEACHRLLQQVPAGVGV